MKQRILKYILNETLFNNSRKRYIIYFIIYLLLGFFNVSMEDIKATWMLEGPVANDKWTLDHVYLNPEIGKLHIWFSDMFNGNEELSE